MAKLKPGHEYYVRWAAKLVSDERPNHCPDMQGWVMDDDVVPLECFNEDTHWPEEFATERDIMRRLRRQEVQISPHNAVPL